MLHVYLLKEKSMCNFVDYLQQYESEFSIETKHMPTSNNVANRFF